MRVAKKDKNFLRQLYLVDPSDSVKDKLFKLFLPALDHRSAIFKYASIQEFSEKLGVPSVQLMLARR